MSLEFQPDRANPPEIFDPADEYFSDVPLVDIVDQHPIESLDASAAEMTLPQVADAATEQRVADGRYGVFINPFGVVKLVRVGDRLAEDPRCEHEIVDVVWPATSLEA